jgi:hypothetical protein
MIDSQAKDAFWHVVEECLIEIHGLSQPDAHGRSMALRARIESPPSGMSSDIFYHAEPFDVACDIVGSQLDLAQYRPQYEPILSRNNW